MIAQAARLLGSWRTDPSDRWSLVEYGEVSLRFDGRGNLQYAIHLQDKTQIMLFTYRVEGNWLVTDQPSAPRQERTEFYFTSDGRLVLKPAAAAAPTFYVRTP